MCYIMVVENYFIPSDILRSTISLDTSIVCLLYNIVSGSEPCHFNFNHTTNLLRQYSHLMPRSSEAEAESFASSHLSVFSVQNRERLWADNRCLGVIALTLSR